MLNLIPELFFILHNLHISYFPWPKIQRNNSLKQGSETKYLILDIAIIMFSFEYTTSSKSVMGYILKIAKPNAFWMDNSFETTTLALSLSINLP